MADHMRRNDKLQSLTESASRTQSQQRQQSQRRQQRPQGQQRSQRSQYRTSSSGRARQAGATDRVTTGQFLKQNATYILSVVAVVVLVVLMILFIRACAPQDRDVPVDKVPSYTSPYDWTKLDRSNNRYEYVVNGQVKSRLGIDVSESQLNIDWQAVANDGIDFAIIRLGYRGATEGDLYLDGYFQSNFEGARNAGIDCGIYFFSQAVNAEEAVEEAEFVLDYLGGAALEYPIAFDSEVVPSLGITRTANLSKDEMTAVADAFCTRLEQAGYKTLVYGNASDLSRYDDSVVNDGGIWWAEYGSAQPNHNLDIVMWQYSNVGDVAGISTDVDMNIDLTGVLQ